MNDRSPDQQTFVEEMRRQIEGYYASAMAYAAVKLGLPEAIGSRPQSAEDLAAAMGLSAPHLHRYLLGLASLGICDELADGRFGLTAAGRSLLPGSPSGLAEEIRVVVEQYWQPWANLGVAIETGTPCFDHVFGMDVWDWRRLNEAGSASFDAWLANSTLAQAGAIVPVLDTPHAGTVADIGGGRGPLLGALLQARPQLAGVLFDRPDVVAAARSYLQSLGLADRTTFVGGDFLAGVPVSADIYLLKSVLHDWDDDGCRTILGNCRQAMRADSKLVIVERLLPPRATDDPVAIRVDLHMLVMNGGRERRLEEFDALLAQSEFARSNANATANGFTVIEAVPR